MRQRHATAGFSLIETLAGLAILSGVLVVTYSTISSSLTTATRLMARKQAVEVVQEQISLVLQHGLDVQTRTLHGETGYYSWSLSLEALPFPGVARPSAVPVRMRGQIRRRDPAAADEMVFDSVFLAAAR